MAIDERLKEIFANLQMRSTTGKAMEDLHKFLEEHPHVDIEPYLAETSVFKGYIKRGLNRLRKRAEALKAQQAQAAATKDDRLEVLNRSQTTTEALRARLRSLKATSSEQEEELPSQGEPVDQQRLPDSKYDIESIRQRLRNMQNSQSGQQNPGGSGSDAQSTTSLEQLRARLAQLKNNSLKG